VATVTELPLHDALGLTVPGWLNRTEKPGYPLFSQSPSRENHRLALARPVRVRSKPNLAIVAVTRMCCGAASGGKDPSSQVEAPKPAFLREPKTSTRRIHLYHGQLKYHKDTRIVNQKSFRIQAFN